MKPIILLAIAVGVGSALVGSMALQFFAPVDNSSAQLGLEAKCKEIAQQGFKVQAKYSEIDLDKIPKEDADKLRYLDNLWINDCVSKLPLETISKIAQKVQDEYYSGE